MSPGDDEAADGHREAPVTLSAADGRELHLLATSGPRGTFGLERSSRQGRLVALGLATFVDDGASVRCEITETGRRKHAGRLTDARRPPSRKNGAPRA